MRVCLLFSCLMSLLACKKSEERTCLKLRGEDSERTFKAPFGDTLSLQPYLNYRFEWANQDEWQVKGGKNEIPFVVGLRKEEGYRFSNQNKCRFLRRYDHPEVLLQCANIKRLVLNHSEALVIESPIFDSNRVEIMIQESSAETALKINTQSFDLATVDTYCPIKLKGTSSTVRWLLKGNCTLDAASFEVSEKLVAMNWGVGDMKLGEVNAELIVEIKGRGNVYYSGNPSKITLTRTGTGELLKQ